MKVSAIVVSHGHAAELAESLPALAPQVDEIVLIANVPGSAPADAHGARVIENPRPLSYAANLNRGIAETTGELVLVNNPDAVPEPGAVAALVAFMDAHPRCGVAGPQLLDPDGSWQPSRRRFPTVGGHARPPHAAPPRLSRRSSTSARTTTSTSARPSRSRPTGCSAARCSSAGRCSTSSAATTPASGCTARRSTSATAPRRRAGSAGTSRQAVVRHRWDAAHRHRRFWTRRTLWHWRSVLRFVRKHPERLRTR